IIDLTLDENVFDDSFIEINDNLSENILEQCLNQYSTQLEFETKIVRAEKEEGVWSRKTYKCRHGGKYEAKKKLDPTQNQDKKSACIKCNFTLNASYRKCPNLVFVNKFIEEHNHVMNINKDLQQFTQSSHKIPDNIIKEIRFYVQECHLGATVLKRILRNKFPNQDIYRQSLYDAIRKFKDSAQIKNDAITLLNRLIKLQQEDPNWYFKLMNKYPEVQSYFERVLYLTKECWAYAFTKCTFSANTHSTQRVESMNQVIKLEANSGSSLCQLHTGIELRLKDEVKYAKLQEFCNINPLAGLPHVSNTIFKDINDVLVLQDSRNVIQQKSNQHDVGFIEDDYEEPQTLLDMALEDCFGKGLILMNEMQESSICIIQNKEELLSTETFQALKNIRGQNVYASPVKNSKKAFYGHRFGLCKKGKGRPSNKRYLSAIENNTMKYAKSNHCDEPAEGLKKRNKRQCSLCKSWYHDSRNYPLKNKPNLEDEICNDKENI
ncbi:18620_t:CDS:2, partial [Rhizophagus irregularis]